MERKTFPFFEECPVAVPELAQVRMTCACACNRFVLFGTEDGKIYSIKEKKYAPTLTNFALNTPILRILAATYSKRLLIVTKNDSSFLFYVLEIEFGENDEIKIAGNSPIRVPNPTNADNISFLSISPKLSRFAFSIDRFKLHVYTIPVNIPDGEEFKIIPYEPTFSSEITGVFLTNNQYLKKYMYVLCRSKIYVYSIGNKGQFQAKILDEAGFDPQPNTSNATVGLKGKLFVARGNVVTCYSSDNKNNTILLESQPKSLYWHRRYLVATFDDKQCSMKIYDIGTDCIFYKSKLGLNTKFMVSAWGQMILFVEGMQSVGKNVSPNMIILNEKETETKLQVLGGFRAFNIALKLAKDLELGNSRIAVIHKRNGDDYYAKHELELAMEEYIQTIGHLECSYVIKRFIEPQQAHLLIKYLEVVQQSSLQQTKEIRKIQTTLLFNCYARLHRDESINQRIQQAIKERGTNKSHASFDVKSAIDVLEKGGYKKQARLLAKEFQLHELYITMLYNSNEYIELFEFLPKTPINVRYYSLLKYGEVIIDNINNDQRHKFATLAADVCTLSYESKDENGEIRVRACDPNEILSIFIMHQDIMYDFIKCLIAKDVSKLTEKLWNNLIHCSINLNPSELVLFLNHPAAKYSDEHALIVVKDAIISLETQKSNYELAQNKRERELKKNPNAELPDDPALNVDINKINQKLEILNTPNIILLEHRKLYPKVLELVAPEEIKKYCEKYEQYDSYIWNTGMNLIGGSKCSDEVLIEFLNTIMDRNIMSYSTVLTYLTKNCSFEVVRQFTLKEFSKLQQEIDEKEKILNEEQNKLEATENQIESLSNDFFLVKPTRCPACNQLTDESSRHFLCGHSFHMACLGSQNCACPKCRQEHLANGQKKLDLIEKAKTETDMLPIFGQSDNGISLLHAVLEGAYFSSEIDNNGENDIEQFMNSIDEIVKIE